MSSEVRPETLMDENAENDQMKMRSDPEVELTVRFDSVEWRLYIVHILN